MTFIEIPFYILEYSYANFNFNLRLLEAFIQRKSLREALQFMCATRINQSYSATYLSNFPVINRTTVSSSHLLVFCLLNYPSKWLKCKGEHFLQKLTWLQISAHFKQYKCKQIPQIIGLASEWTYSVLRVRCFTSGLCNTPPSVTWIWVNAAHSNNLPRYEISARDLKVITGQVLQEDNEIDANCLSS